MTKCFHSASRAHKSPTSWQSRADPPLPGWAPGDGGERSLADALHKPGAPGRREKTTPAPRADPSPGPALALTGLRRLPPCRQDRPGRPRRGSSGIQDSEVLTLPRCSSSSILGRRALLLPTRLAAAGLQHLPPVARAKSVWLPLPLPLPLRRRRLGSGARVQRLLLRASATGGGWRRYRRSCRQGGGRGSSRD